MAAIDDPRAAEQLARAIVTDILIYNEDAVVQSLKTGRALRDFREQLGEAKQLYDSRVNPAVRAAGPLFACVVLEQVRRWAAARKLPVAGLDQALAAVLGESAQAMAAFRGAPAAPAARPPAAPGAAPDLAFTPTPLAPTSAHRLPARNAFHDGHLVLEPQAMCFERADAAGPLRREEIPLADVQELRLRRQHDGSWELGIASGMRSESWALGRVEDAVVAARHVLGRLGRS